VDLAISVIVSGIAIGLLIGLLSFVLVFLNKTTGIANFAIGNIGMFEAFIVYELSLSGLNVWVAVVIGLVVSMVLGALVYQVVMRPFSKGQAANLLVRTVGLYLLLAAMADVFFGQNQPYTFPNLLPQGGVSVGTAVISWSSLITVAIVLVVVALFAAMFRFTQLGVQFQAVAQRASIAQLLGLRVRRLSMIAYIIAAPLALIVALLIAPSQLLSSSMMDSMLLYAFAAAVVGGFSSLSGTFVGGIIIGVVTDVVATYVGGDLSLMAALAIMLLTLAIRPNGLFGVPQVERL
jgi:branched-chain amino acid transport system permease protein